MKNRRLRIAARLSLSAGARADAPPLYQTWRSRSSSSSDNRERRPMMPARNGDSHDPRRIDRSHGAACRAFGGRVRVQRSRPGSRAAVLCELRPGRARRGRRPGAVRLRPSAALGPHLAGGGTQAAVVAQPGHPRGGRAALRRTPGSAGHRAHHRARRRGRWRHLDRRSRRPAATAARRAQVLAVGAGAADPATALRQCRPRPRPQPRAARSAAVPVAHPAVQRRCGAGHALLCGRARPARVGHVRRRDRLSAQPAWQRPSPDRAGQVRRPGPAPHQLVRGLAG